MLSILSKSELIDVVLREIRKHEGCEGVSTVVILEKPRHSSSPANWEISIVVAEKGDPVAVQLAAAKVQALLETRHRLADDETAPGNWKAGPE